MGYKATELFDHHPEGVESKAIITAQRKLCGTLKIKRQIRHIPQISNDRVGERQDQQDGRIHYSLEFYSLDSHETVTSRITELLLDCMWLYTYKFDEKPLLGKVQVSSYPSNNSYKLFIPIFDCYGSSQQPRSPDLRPSQRPYCIQLSIKRFIWEYFWSIESMRPYSNSDRTHDQNTAAVMQL